MSKQIIHIDGYWLDDKATFEDRKCVVGEPWNGIEDNEDQSIFYYFQNEEELKRFRETKKDGRTDTEFVITKVRRIEPHHEYVANYYDNKNSGEYTGD